MFNLPDSSDAQPDEAAFLNLALSLLSTYSGLRAYELLVSSIPAYWPADVPILQGSRIDGCLVRAEVRRENADDYTDLTLLSTTNLSEDDTLNAYDDLIMSLGWHVYDIQEKDRGFSSHATTWDLEYVKGAYGPLLQVRVRDASGSDASTEVCLFLNKDPNSLWHYRHKELPTLRSQQVMPALRPPKHSQQGSCASNGNDSSWNCNVGMLTELDSPSLLSHYAAQLAHAGWLPVDNGQSGPVTWHTWDVRDEHGDKWVGALLILERQGKRSGGKRRYYLSVHTYKV